MAFFNHLAYVVGYMLLFILKYAVYAALVVSGTLYLNVLFEDMLEKITPVELQQSRRYLLIRVVMLSLCLVIMLVIVSGLYKIIGIR